MVPQVIGSYVHRPLSAYLNLVIDEGCVIRRIVEPTLTPEGVTVLGDRQRDVHVPNFVVVSATKGSQPGNGVRSRSMSDPVHHYDGFKTHDGLARTPPLNVCWARVSGAGPGLPDECGNVRTLGV